MEIKSQIEQSLLTSNKNKLNSRKTEYLESMNPELFESILRETLFLPKEATLHERIYCVMNNIDDIPLCPFCSDKRSYVLYRGYRATCGKARCGLHLRYQKEEQHE